MFFLGICRVWRWLNAAAHLVTYLVNTLKWSAPVNTKSPYCPQRGATQLHYCLAESRPRQLADATDRAWQPIPTSWGAQGWCAARGWGCIARARPGPAMNYAILFVCRCWQKLAIGLVVRGMASVSIRVPECRVLLAGYLKDGVLFLSSWQNAEAINTLAVPKTDSTMLFGSYLVKRDPD